MRRVFEQVRQVAKLANQMMMVNGFCAIAEAFGFMERMGVDAGRCLEAIEHGGAESRLLGGFARQYRQAVEAARAGLPVVIVYDEVPGGVGLSPRLVDLWPQLAHAARELVSTCPCTDGCPSCVGPTGEHEPGAKAAASRLLEVVTA